MYLKIGENGELSLEDCEDFSRFSISAARPGGLAQGSSSAFGGLAEYAGDGHYWLDADAVARLSPRHSDLSWSDAFWAMLAKAERFGYYDARKRRVKAHVS